MWQNYSPLQYTLTSKRRSDGLTPKGRLHKAGSFNKRVGTKKKNPFVTNPSAARYQSTT